MRVINNDEAQYSGSDRPCSVSSRYCKPEIYNKDGNKEVNLYGKAISMTYFSKDNGVNSYGGNGDKTYAPSSF
ncbi:hypothetical protein ACNKHW_05930 [Shigella flexneri]